MNNIIKETKKLKEILYENEIVNNYLSLKEAVYKDTELESLRNSIAKEAFLGNEENKNNLIKIYNANPVVHNYNIAKEDLKHLLEELKDILSE